MDEALMIILQLSDTTTAVQGQSHRPRQLAKPYDMAMCQLVRQDRPNGRLGARTRSYRAVHYICAVPIVASLVDAVAGRDGGDEKPSIRGGLGGMV